MSKQGPTANGSNMTLYAHTKSSRRTYFREDEEYPFYLTTGRIAHYHHTTLRNAPLSRELIPVPDMRMNPVDAEKVGVKHGDWVEVSSRRGKTERSSLHNQGRARPGVVMMERFYFPESYDRQQKKMTGELALMQCQSYGAR